MKYFLPLFFLPFFCLAEEFELSYRWKVSRVRHHNFCVEETFRFTKEITGGVEFVNRFRLAYQVEERVVSASSGKVLLSWQFRRFSFYRKQANIEFTCDTQREATHPFARILRPVFLEILRHKVYFTVNPKGEVLELKGVGSLWSRAKRKIPPAFQGYLQKFFGLLFLPSSFRAMFSMIHPPLPWKKVKKRGVWERSFELPHLGGKGKFVYKLRRSLKRQGKKEWLISVQAELIPKGRGEGMGGIPFQGGRGEGRYLLSQEGETKKLRFYWKIRVLLQGVTVSGKEVWSLEEGREE